MPARTSRAGLRIQETSRDRAPAVLVLHSLGGIDATGMSYIEPLNRARIATLAKRRWNCANVLEKS